MSQPLPCIGLDLVSPYFVLSYLSTSPRLVITFCLPVAAPAIHLQRDVKLAQVEEGITWAQEIEETLASSTLGTSGGEEEDEELLAELQALSLSSSSPSLQSDIAGAEANVEKKGGKMKTQDENEGEETSSISRDAEEETVRKPREKRAAIAC